MVVFVVSLILITVQIHIILSVYFPSRVNEEQLATTVLLVSGIYI